MFLIQSTRLGCHVVSRIRIHRQCIAATLNALMEERTPEIHRVIVCFRSSSPLTINRNMQRAVLLVAALQVVVPGSWQTLADSLPPSTIISKQRITAKTRERVHGSPSGRRARPTKAFVYVYDMPAKFTSDVKALNVEWHPEQYDYDQVSPCTDIRLKYVYHM